MTKNRISLHPSERVTLKMVIEGENTHGKKRNFKSLEEKGLLYLSPAGWGSTDLGKAVYHRYYGGR